MRRWLVTATCLNDNVAFLAHNAEAFPVVLHLVRDFAGSDRTTLHAVFRKRNDRVRSPYCTQEHPK